MGKITLERIPPPGPPKVWDVVECVKKDGSGESIKFHIQEIPEDRYDDVVDHMATYFIADEPVCKSIDGKNNPEFKADFCAVWKMLLQQGVSVGAFVDDPNGGKPIIAGANMLLVEDKEHEHGLDDMDLKSPVTRHVVSVILGLTNEAHVYEKYGVNMYMSALGLSVHPSYRGRALGLHILNARQKIGQAYNIPVTSTAFTSPISQKLASRAGFEVLFERNYDEILDGEGKQAFPGIDVKTFKIMARRLY